MDIYKTLSLWSMMQFHNTALKHLSHLLIIAYSDYKEGGIVTLRGTEDRNVTMYN